jgi:ferredoxin-NADP reductase
MSAGEEQYRRVIITSVREEIPGVKTFTATYDDGSPIPYAAGQFITFIFTHHGKEERRSFSISSSPDENKPLAFTVKRLDNGAYSRYLIDRTQPGDKLLTTGTAGLFVIPADITAYDQVFFFAAGIGITPVISLIKNLLHTYPEKQAVLVYSNRSQDDVVFYNELQALAAKYPGRLALDLLYSNAFNLARARLNKALVPLILSEHGAVPKEKMLFYVCGPFQYMRMVIYALEEQKIHATQIHKENFNTNNRPIKENTPPDIGAHKVTLIQNGQEFTLTVQYPESILQAALRQGIHLPYSCETGRCGSLRGKMHRRLSMAFL